MTFTIISGWLSDRIGRIKLYRIQLVLLAFCPLPLISLIENGSMGEIWLAMAILGMFAGMYIGAEPVLQAELFPTNIRNTSLSLSYNVSTSIFGGLTPYILQLLLIRTGTLASGAYYLAGCTIISFVALFFYKDRSNES